MKRLPNNLPSNFNQTSFVSRCPHCDAEYNSDQVETVDQKDNVITVYLNCPQCKSSIIAAVLLSGMGLVSLGLVTDMTKEDVKRFKKSRDISSDDILILHQTLKEDSQDFIKKFK